jgi:hypothetical protein
MAQRAERHALTDHGGGLGGAAIQRWQRVEPRSHQALHGVGELAGAGGGGAQELLEEERIAVGAVHAGVGDRRRNVVELRRQRGGVFDAEWRQLDDTERHAQPPGAPWRVGSVALAPRRHHDEGRAVGGGVEHGGEAIARRRIGPVHVLDDHQLRPLFGGADEQDGQDRGAALGATGRVERIDYGAQRRRRRDVEHLVQGRAQTRREQAIEIAVGRGGGAVERIGVRR